MMHGEHCDLLFKNTDICHSTITDSYTFESCDYKAHALATHDRMHIHMLIKRPQTDRKILCLKHLLEDNRFRI